MNLNDYPLWTALVTPMNEDGGVDYEGLKKLFREQEEADNALLVLGSTGEALNLKEDERKTILNVTLNLNLKVPLMIGVGGINIEETKSWINYLNTFEGIHAYLLVTPLYAKPGDYGQYLWFKALMDISLRPVMLYNVPSRTGTALSHKAVKNLVNHPKFWAVKEASGSTKEFSRYRQDAPNVHIYSGDDALLPDFSPLGAKGLVSVAGNVWPKQTHNYVCQNLQGKFKDRNLWDNACKCLFVASNPVPTKFLLKKLGKIKHDVLRLPLSQEDMIKGDEVLRESENIANWS